MGTVFVDVVWSKIQKTKLSNCNYCINNLEVTSSNLVTPTKSPNFQTLYFLPFFKAQQGIAYHLVNYFTIPILFQYSSNSTYLLLKCGYHVVSKKLTPPLTYCMRICILITINANNNKLENDDAKQ